MTNKEFLVQYLGLRKEAAEPVNYHTVEEGQSFPALDRKYKMRPGSFRRVNKGVHPNKIQIGHQLVIPDKSYLISNGPEIPKGYTYKPSLNLMRRIMQHESDSGRNLFGDWDPASGTYKSVGVAQIKAVQESEKAKYLRNRNRARLPASMSRVIDDVNDNWGTNYTLDDRYDASRSLNIMRKYLILAGTDYFKYHGKNPTDADYLRAWNAGREWYRSTNPNLLPNANAYVKKVTALPNYFKSIPIIPLAESRRRHFDANNKKRAKMGMPLLKWPNTPRVTNQGKDTGAVR